MGRMSFRSRPVGWQYEAQRHRLARMGIATYRRRPGYVGSVQGIPIYARSVAPGRAYPISPEEVRSQIGAMPKSDVAGIKKIEFVEPKGEQKEAYAQYVRSQRVIRIFGQPMSSDGRIDGEDPQKFRRWMKRYVIPHEIGHFKALKTGKTDSDIEMAEARADANVVGMAPYDKDVSALYALRKRNI